MSESIKLNAFQRLSLESILNQQRGSVSNLMTTYDLINKIKLTKEQSGSNIKELPDGRVMVDRNGLATIPDEEIHLEKAEKRKLTEIINGYESFGPSDLEWVMPIKKQLIDA